MVAPRAGEHLKLYLAATPQTASAVLVVEREEPVLPKKSTATPSPEPPDEGTVSPDPVPGPQPQVESSTSAPAEAPPQANLAKTPEEPLEGADAAAPSTTLVEHPV